MRELDPTPPLLINARAASERLAISERKLWSLTNFGAIPSRRVGRLVRYVPEELDRWVASGCPSSPAESRRRGEGC